MKEVPEQQKREQTNWQEANETTLVQHAQNGDRDAYGELVRRHRGKVYGYARSLTNETFMAEDIVQDAMIRAFLHLSDLTDSSRFLPWLQTIIRNQAYTSLKKHTQAKEQVFSAMQQSYEGDFEAILYKLSSSLSMRDQEYDPEGLLLRKEMLRSILDLLNCLSQRERRIFESFFFKQLPPGQIAELFQTSSTNVYQIISRSRKKLIQQKIRVEVDQYVGERKESGCVKKVVLAEPKKFHKGRTTTWTSAADALHSLLGYTGTDLSLSMVMGLTSHAFRINIVAENIHIAGPTLYHFGDVLGQGLSNMGFRARFIMGTNSTIQITGPGPNYQSLDDTKKTEKAKSKRLLPETLPQALEFIHHSIDRGHAVIGWDLDVPEFSVIYGYDDENELFIVRNPHGNEIEVPYDHLGRGTAEELFVLALDSSFERNRREMLQDALTMILDHYLGRGEQAPGSVSGLNAYDSWIKAFQLGCVEPIGNAYNVAVVHDARTHACTFFEELATGWIKEDQVTQLSAQLASVFRRVSQHLEELKEMFPFPKSGEPNRPQNVEKAIELLEKAKAGEQKAVQGLKKLEEILNTK